MLIMKYFSEKTAIISPYDIDRLVAIAEIECLLRGTNCLFSHNSSWYVYFQRYLTPLRVNTCTKRDGSSKVGQHPSNHSTKTHTHTHFCPLAASITASSLLALNIARRTSRHDMQMRSDAMGTRKGRKLRGTAMTSCRQKTALQEY